jgi:hypothetical protein
MKFVKLFAFSLPLVLSWGCIYSHRNGVVYGPEPVVVTPTSERHVVRVYPEPTTVVVPSTVVPVPSTTSTYASGDVAIAGAMRRMFEADPNLASSARNVRITVLNGQVTMTGTVVTQNDREALHSAVNTTPGVSRVDDRVQVDLNR